MPIQFTIIGLGQVGASIGLALGRVKDQVTRVGSDQDPNVARQAEKMGAIDKTIFNLPAAVRGADVVILALPVDEIRSTMEAIAQDLKAGAVLVDTSPVKAKIMEWAKELLPEDRYFVGLTPSLNPAYLMETNHSVENAHADLFQKSLMLITSLPGVDESAITLATNLTEILGATPLFTDPVEADGLVAYSHLLPYLVSASLVTTTNDQAGWREARKLAGHAYAQATEPALHSQESKDLGQTVLMNRDNVVRMLDQMLTELQSIRDALAEDNVTTLQERLEHARQWREQWWNQRLTADWEVKDTPRPPSGNDILGRLFGVGPKREKGKK